MKLVNCHFIAIRFIALVTVSLSFTANAQNTCDGASLVDGLDIQLSCLRAGNDVYSTHLENITSAGLVWQWGGQLSPANCTVDPTLCTDVGTDLSLVINNINIEGLPHRVELAHAPDLGQFHWRYRSNTALTSPVLNSAALEQIRSFMQEAVGVDKEVPGAVLGLAQGGSIIFMEAFGMSDTRTGDALTTDHLMHIASTNKAVTSFLIATLVDEGILEWDTRAIDIYPGFTTSDASASMNITIRQLLNMTSGLPRDGDIETDEPARVMFDRLSEQTLIATPGTQYQYSNLGISIAGYLGVLARTKASLGSVSDTDLDTLHSDYTVLLQEKVLTPIAMTNSYVSANAARATGLLSSSHQLAGSRFIVSESEDVDPDNASPSGGLKSTAGDMLRYIITDMQQGLTPEGTRVATTENVTERQKLSPGPASDEEYGLSLEIMQLDNGLDYIGHTGSFDNFNSVMGFFPQSRLAFVLLTNGESPAALELTENGLPEHLGSLLGGPD